MKIENFTTSALYAPNQDAILPDNESFLDYALQHGFGEVHCKIDPATGMQAIIAIHSTKLGPALGGCRFISYPNSKLAIYDAMRLARGMSYKSALANLPLGGGKSVIIRPQTHYDHPAYFHQFGEFIQSLNGRYITALDSGTQLSDMDIIAEHTPYVASLSTQNSDPSPYTARGIIRGIKAAVEFNLGKSSLAGLHFAVQGLGHVGQLVAKALHAQDAKLTVSDINSDLVNHIVKTYDAKTVAPEDIHKIPCDAFVPCALGAVINDVTINQLQTTIIAGAANNQLAHSYHGQKLHEKGILYATDYVINAGGVIYAASSYFDTTGEEVEQKVNAISTTLMTIFERSKKENLPTSDIADIMAQEKLAS